MNAARPGRAFGRATDLSLLRMILRYWWVVVVVLVAFVGLAFFVDANQPVEFEARAQLIVEDPRASQLFEVTDLGRPSTQSSERYLADQVEIVRSPEVANVASELLDGRFTGSEVLLRRSVSGDLTSNLIEVFFTADSRSDAQAGANAVAEAYQEVRRRQVQATAAVALAKVDALLAAVDDELAQIDESIAAVQAGDESLQELNRQFAAAQEELNTLRITRDRLAVDSELRAAINAQIDELLRDFSAWEVVLRISERGSELNNLLADKDAAAAEKATLVARANSIEVDAELAAGGVTLYSPAELPVDPSGFPLEILLALALVLGLVVATVVVYYLALRRESVQGFRVPRAVLDAPLLAEVPHFELEGIRSATPVNDVPASAAAEAFRFAAAAIEIRTADSSRTVAVVSAVEGTGRSAVVANTGLAAAARGMRVLVIDADFGKQDLAQMLMGEVPGIGLNEVISGQASIEDCVVSIPVSGNGSLALLSSGGAQVGAAAYLRSDRATGFFAAAAAGVDLVLIDSAPLLQTEYALALAGHSDAAIVVVEHGSDVRELREVREHLSEIAVPILGYVYTKAQVLPPSLDRPIGQVADAAPKLKEVATEDVGSASPKLAGSGGTSAGA